MPPVFSDSLILPIAARGDRVAVQACITRFGGLVWSLARRLSRDTAEAEDAAQEIFLDLWKSAERFDPARSSEAGFVAAVAHRRIVGRRRAGSRTLSGEPLELEEDERSFERTVAALDLAALTGTAEPPPETLGARVSEDARVHFGWHTAVAAVPLSVVVPPPPPPRAPERVVRRVPPLRIAAPALRPVTRKLVVVPAAPPLPRPPANDLLGGARIGAAAGCAVIALWWLFSPPAPAAQQVSAPPPTQSAPPAIIEPPPTPPPSLAQQRALLLIEADAMQLAWTPAREPSAKGASGDVAWSDAMQKGFIRFRGLAPNEATEQQYQLWIFDPGRDARYPVDAGVFDISSAEADAAGDVIIPFAPKLRVRTPSMFEVTLEKPGGVVVSGRARIALTAAPKN